MRRVFSDGNWSTASDFPRKAVDRLEKVFPGIKRSLLQEWPFMESHNRDKIRTQLTVPFAASCLSLVENPIPVEELLGCGTFGCVFSSTDGRVVKVTSDEYEGRSWKVIQRLQEHFHVPRKVFPTVYDVIVCERDEGDMAIIVRDAVMPDRHVGEEVENLFYKYRTTKSDEAIDFVDDINYMIDDVGINVSDLHQENIGRTEDGDIVAFDFVLAYSDVEMSRLERHVEEEIRESEEEA